MTADRDQILSEFIDAWNAGQRPDVDDFVARVPASDRGELADQLMSFMTFAPTPNYSDAALQAIRREPIVAEALAATSARGGLLPALLTRMRERASWSTTQVASALVSELDLPDEKASKTASYLEQIERGTLETSGISGRVFAALARIFGVTRDELEGAADMSRWAPLPAPSAAPSFRASKDAAEAVAPDLELLARALHTPGAPGRDEVDDLFLGGR